MIANVVVSERLRLLCDAAAGDASDVTDRVLFGGHRAAHRATKIVARARSAVVLALLIKASLGSRMTYSCARRRRARVHSCVSIIGSREAERIERRGAWHTAFQRVTMRSQGLELAPGIDGHQERLVKLTLLSEIRSASSRSRADDHRGHVRRAELLALPYGAGGLAYCTFSVMYAWAEHAKLDARRPRARRLVDVRRRSAPRRRVRRALHLAVAPRQAARRGEARRRAVHRARDAARIRPRSRSTEPRPMHRHRPFPSFASRSRGQDATRAARPPVHVRLRRHVQGVHATRAHARRSGIATTRSKSSRRRRRASWRAFRGSRPAPTPRRCSSSDRRPHLAGRRGDRAAPPHAAEGAADRLDLQDSVRARARRPLLQAGSPATDTGSAAANTVSRGRSTSSFATAER